MWTRTRLGTMVLAVFWLCGVAAARAQGTAAAPAAATPDVEPAALEALDKMGAYLRTLTSFEIHATGLKDEVLDNGQKLQFALATHLRVKRPNRMWAELTTDRKVREFFYDGTTFTLWAPRDSYYASVPAPATLRELGDKLDDKYGIEIPLGDLFRWGTDPTRRDLIKEAMYVGPAVVGGQPCDQYAFRQETVDWQVWIQKGDSPLPLKLVVTTTDDEAQPEYTSQLDWNLAPALADSMFTFKPPAKAYPIKIQERAAEPAGH